MRMLLVISCATILLTVCLFRAGTRVVSSGEETNEVSPTKPDSRKTKSTSEKKSAEDRHSRLAIISAVEGKQSPLEAFLLSEASGLGGMEFLERAEIARAMEEQNLNASGLLQPDKAIELGRLLSADILLLIEPEAGGTESSLRIRAVETQGGIRLLDRQTAPVPKEPERSRLLADLRRCVRKSHVPQDKRHYVAAVGFRSEELGNSLTAEAQILGALLEQDLAAMPSVVMLERKNVGQLTAEQTLAGLAPRLAAHGSGDRGWASTRRRWPQSGRNHDVCFGG